MKFAEPAPLAACFAIVGRLYAIARALDYDMAPHRLAYDERAVVPRPIWDATMRAWTLARGGE